MAKKKSSIKQMLSKRHSPSTKVPFYSRHRPELIALVKEIAEKETERLGRKVHQADIVSLALERFAEDYEKESA